MVTEDEMVGWHHQLNGHDEFKQTLGDSEGQESLEFAETPVYWVSDAIQPSHPLSPPSPLALNLFQD